MMVLPKLKAFHSLTTRLRTNLTDTPDNDDDTRFRGTFKINVSVVP